MSEAQAWLGKLLPEEVERDATHVAVVPVIAGEDMEPGNHCGVHQGVAVLGEKCIGIVDPFLVGRVNKGDRFYLCLYPRSVVGLRHVYTHPVLDAAAVPQAPPAKSPAASERWLRDYIARYTGRADGYPSYEDVLDKIRHLYPEETQLFHEVEVEDEARQSRHDDEQLPPEFWEHAEIVMGRRIHNRATYFACCT